MEEAPKYYLYIFSGTRFHRSSPYSNMQYKTSNGVKMYLIPQRSSLSWQRSPHALPSRKRGTGSITLAPVTRSLSPCQGEGPPRSFHPSTSSHVCVLCLGFISWRGILLQQRTATPRQGTGSIAVRRSLPPCTPQLGLGLLLVSAAPVGAGSAGPCPAPAGAFGRGNY